MSRLLPWLDERQPDVVCLPPGALFHWVTKTDDGIRVTDVWDSREVFDRFSAEQIGPHTQAVGIRPSEVTFHDVHSYLTSG